jgi:hypothetical protein
MGRGKGGGPSSCWAGACGRGTPLAAQLELGPPKQRPRLRRGLRGSGETSYLASMNRVMPAIWYSWWVLPILSFTCSPTFLPMRAWPSGVL